MVKVQISEEGAATALIALAYSSIVWQNIKTKIQLSSL
jgi:hypothetical protein